MRLSEKTIELTFCSQFALNLGIQDVIWFGLTQAQEKRLGFDACTMINGRLLILQFKASNYIVNRGFSRPRRRFTVPHFQLERLQTLAGAFHRMVYYAFPNLGNTLELSLNRNVVSQTWFLDVNSLPTPFPRPTNTSQKHYAYIDPPQCELRSKAVNVELVTPVELKSALVDQLPNSKEFVDWCQDNDFNFKGLRTYGILWKL